MIVKSFASDNYAGVHPEIMDALITSNKGHAGSYGNDEYTTQAIETFRKHFHKDCDVFFVYNGTGANVLGLSILLRSFNSVICSDLAHINVDESTAPEKFLGCKLVTIPTKNGKIYPHEIESKIQRLNDQHHPQVKVISISQPTEYGTVYSTDEIRSISELCKKYNFYFHMDGARISNAAVSLNETFKTFTHEAGVDVLSFGGTKNGMMFGEAVVVFNKELSTFFPYLRKLSMQLHSKMRFISAQFVTLLSNDLWKRNAEHANKMAAALERGLRQVKSISITQEVQANSVFAIMPAAMTTFLQKRFPFYVWNDKKGEVRLMCAFDTTTDDVTQFLGRIKEWEERKNGI